MKRRNVRLKGVLALIALLVIGNGCTRSRQAVIEVTPSPATVLATQSETITAIEPSAALSGQTIYVPAYSHIYYHDRQSLIHLTITLSVRNADPTHAIWVNSVQYYDANGGLVRNDLEAPQQLAPLASLEFVVEEDDTSGGSGASFLVNWSSTEQTVAPVVEAVMISAASTQGISFVTVGRVIEEFQSQAQE